MVMTATILSSEARASILDTLAKKAEQACFVDWIVGTCIMFYYGEAALGGTLENVSLWPLIAALAITRAGDTIRGSFRDVAYWKGHPANGQR